MPAPLAKGLILSLSLLLAAGYAVYENPQVRAWVDERRRQLTAALSGEDWSPSSSSGGRPIPLSHRQRTSPEDLSTREDDSPAAVERRRAARQHILERVAKARASRQGSRRRGASFDDFLDAEGNLKGNGASSSSSGIQIPVLGPEDEGLRNRSVGPSGKAAAERAAFTSAAAVAAYNSGLTEDEALERATLASASSFDDSDASATFEAVTVAEAAEAHSEGTGVAAAAAAAAHEDAETASTISDATPLELTPTTSRAPSSFHPAVLTPRSAAFAGSDPADLIDFDDWSRDTLGSNGALRSSDSRGSPGSPPISVPDEDMSFVATPRSGGAASVGAAAAAAAAAAPAAGAAGSQAYASIREWAERSLAETDAADQNPGQRISGHHGFDVEMEEPRTPMSEAMSFLSAGEADVLSPRDLEVLSVGDVDALSDFDGAAAMTPHSWTEVGSAVSGEEVR